MNPKLTYARGSTYAITHNYTAPTYLGQTLYFVVKSVPNDTDVTDMTNVIMAPKVITMSGSTFPQTTTITIVPTDVAVSMEPGNYFYSIKVKDTNADEYVCVLSAPFVLTASTVNET
jgi:hypothetical protein